MSMRYKLVGTLLATVSVLTACTGSSSGSSATPATIPDIQAEHCPATVQPGAAQPSALPALTTLAREESTPLLGPVVHGGHGLGGSPPPLVIDPGSMSAFVRELDAASGAACALRTTADAARAGYVPSAPFNDGSGVHWTNWSLIDRSFDPAHPSQLLYSRTNGQLVGLSYWVRTSDPDGPSGFAGNADRWHRHFGLCYDDTGMEVAEDVQRPATCKGPWINGKDMWMLHAWVVPGQANRWGLFADENPTQCRATLPGLRRCVAPNGA